MGLTSCISAPPPYQEFTLARTAVQAAQDADAARFATGLWQKAEDQYRRGEKSYKSNEFDEAKSHFQKAIHFAEQAENATRLKKFENGDTF
jgi:hypothetical protein